MQLNLEGLTQEQLDSIKKQIEVFEKENEKPRDVIDYENGWIINGYSEIESAGEYVFSAIDKHASIGLYRDTKEECEKLIKKMKIEHRLRQWSKMCKDKVDWNDKKQDKYFIRYSNYSHSVGIDQQGKINSNCIYFTDKSILEKAIADIGEQKLIDEYFVEV